MTVFTVHVYCGNYVGEPHWHGTESYEPDECNADLDVEIEAEIELEHATYVCPGCGATNTVRDHS